jgi:hypothetical protein
VLEVLDVVAGVRIPSLFVSVGALPVECAMLEIALVSGPIVPNKFSQPMFFSLEILPFIDSLIILFLPLAMRLFIDPLPFILKIGRLIGIDPLFISSTNEMTAIGIHENTVIEFRSVLLIDFSFEVAGQFSVFFDFIDFNFSFWQFVLVGLFAVSVDYVIGSLHAPDFVVVCAPS